MSASWPVAEKRYGVLCLLPEKGRDKVVLVSRPGSKEWIHPKGRRIPGMSGRGSARREAYEEGGIRGRIHPGQKTVVTCRQGGRKVLLTLYAMRVEKMLKRWPERRKRDRIVVSSAKAAQLLRCPGMRKGLRALIKKNP